MVPIGESLANYVVELVRATRHNSGSAPDFIKKYVNYGASVRAAQLSFCRRKRAPLHIIAITSRMRTSLRWQLRASPSHPFKFHAESDRIDSDEILRRLLEHMPPPAKA